MSTAGESKSALEENECVWEFDGKEYVQVKFCNSGTCEPPARPEKDPNGQVIDPPPLNDRVTTPCILEGPDLASDEGEAPYA